MHTLPPSVRLVTGAGGLDVVRVDGAAAAASAEIYLHGAQVTAWAPAGEAPVLWMSERSRFAAGAAIRGGVPICFPWFGAHATDPSAPAHGFARLRAWELVEVHETSDEVVVTLRLTDDDATRDSAWPHRFDATYTVHVGRVLTLAFTVTNRDDVDVTFEAALHTYLAVADVRDVELTGLQGAPFVDRLDGPAPAEAHPVRFSGETDRIYQGTRAPVTLHDRTSGRTVMVAKEGSDATVVWNPWVAKAVSMADFGDDEWTGMVCVETCNVRDTAVTLAPGGSHTMTAVLEVGH